MNSSVKLALLTALIGVCVIAGCGIGQTTGSATGSQPTGEASIVVSPNGVSITPGSTLQFVAELLPGRTTVPVAWSLGGPGCSGTVCGVIDAAGNYTAPSSPLAPAITVMARSSANPSLVAEAIITIGQVPVAGCESSFFGGGDHVAPAMKGNTRFTPIGSMSEPRGAHSAILLPNGKVLIVNGGQLDIDDLLIPIAWAELFDPSQQSFTQTGTPCRTREFHTATLLANGKVLVAGGNEFDGYPTWLAPTETSELYDPTTGTFANTGSMSVGRTYHTATLLVDGRVLIVGGWTNNGSGLSTTTESLASSEIYDPATETFSPGGNMSSPRAGHTATRLASGKVLIVGGQNDQGALATAELYDPQTNSFSKCGFMTAPRTGQTATLLPSGKVLVAGGASADALFPGSIAPQVPLLPTAELYDPNTNSFVSTGSMHDGRIAHTATLLLDGTVLIAGGYRNYMAAPTWLGYESLDSAEIYDPMTASFTITGPMNATRFWHTATALQDSSVLITGGIGSDLPQASAEIFK
jgi:hypothetical protein